MTEEIANATALAVVEPAELAIPEASEFRGYVGASLLKLSETEAASLAAILPDEDHDILPTGEVYVTQVRYRRLLNATLGPGQWALVPRGGWTRQGTTLCREYALVVRGSFVAESVGEAEYQESNERMTWATAAESCKSNALTRCCKDLGIASECWDRHWADAWVKKYAVKVWCERRNNKGKDGYQWRRRDAQPFWNEAQQPGREATAADPTAAPAVQSGHVSEAQIKRLFALGRARAGELESVSHTEIVRDVLNRRGVEHTLEIKRADYEAICAAVQQWEPPGAQAEPIPGFDAASYREPGEDDVEAP